MTLITDGDTAKRYNRGMEQSLNHSSKTASLHCRMIALRRVQFLKPLPDAVLDTLAQAGHERLLLRGEMLFVERERCLGLIVVLSGAVKVYKTDARGRELTLDREMPGESVFELPLFDGGNYPAGAEAAEDDTRVYIVPRDRFAQIMADCPQIAVYALRALAARQRKLIQMVEAHSLHSVRARLAAYLHQAWQTENESLRAARGLDKQGHDGAGLGAFELSETNEAIASRIGTVREVVSRTLHSFKDAGIVRINGRSVCVCDLDALRQAAGLDTLDDRFATNRNF